MREDKRLQGKEGKGRGERGRDERMGRKKREETKEEPRRVKHQDGLITEAKILRYRTKPFPGCWCWSVQQTTTTTTTTHQRPHLDSHYCRLTIHDG